MPSGLDGIHLREDGLQSSLPPWKSGAEYGGEVMEARRRRKEQQGRALGAIADEDVGCSPRSNDGNGGLHVGGLGGRWRLLPHDDSSWVWMLDVDPVFEISE